MQAHRSGPYSPTLLGGPAAADAVLASGATAVVCHNDMLAIGLMRRLAERGGRCPRDLSVVGFDDIFGADFCSPALTTLAERTEDAGARAVEALVRADPAAARRPADPGAADAAGRARVDRPGAGRWLRKARSASGQPYAFPSIACVCGIPRARSTVGRMSTDRIAPPGFAPARTPGPEKMIGIRSRTPGLRRGHP